MIKCFNCPSAAVSNVARAKHSEIQCLFIDIDVISYEYTEYVVLEENAY